MKQLLSKIFIASFFVLAFIAFSPKADALIAGLPSVGIDDTEVLTLEDSGIGGSGGSSSGSTNTSPLYININGIQDIYKKGELMPFTISAYYLACTNVNLAITGEARIGGYSTSQSFAGEVVGGQSLYESLTLTAPESLGTHSLIMDLTAKKIQYAVVLYDSSGDFEHVNTFADYQSAYDYMLLVSGYGESDYTRYSEGNISSYMDMDGVLARAGNYAIINANQYLASKQIILSFYVVDGAEPISVQISATDESGQNTASAGETLTIKKGETARIQWTVSNDIPDYCRLKSLSTSAMATLKETTNSESGLYDTGRLEEDTKYYVTCGKQDQ